VFPLGPRSVGSGSVWIHPAHASVAGNADTPTDPNNAHAAGVQQLALMAGRASSRSATAKGASVSAESQEVRWSSLLDPVLVSRLEGLDLRARLVVEGFLAGLHRSPYRGFSVEFAEHRAYMPGDPLRHVDWKVFARSEKLFVKEFEEETNLRCYFLLDASASMGFGPEGISKLAYATTLAAALSYLMLRQRDSVGLQVFSGSVEEYLPARSVPSHLGNIVHILERVQPRGSTGLGMAFADLARRARRRGLVILLSDLIAPADELSLGLSHFRHKKHEMIVMHVVHPWEVQLPYKGAVLLRDPEGDAKTVVQPSVVRREYQRRLRDFWTQRRLLCQSKGADYVQVRTDTPFDRTLGGYLEKRSRLK
jgi:uncharacterized protein (DUF58 family)